MIFALFIGVVYSYTEQCTEHSRSSLSLECPRPHHGIFGSVSIGADDGSATCGQADCTNSYNECRLLGECLNLGSCEIAGSRVEEALDCDGATVHTHLACVAKDPYGGACIGDTACWQTEFTNDQICQGICAAKFSASTTPGPGQWKYDSPSSRVKTNLATNSPCQLVNRGTPFDPVLECDTTSSIYHEANGALDTGAEFRCYAEGVLLLLPGSEDFDNYEVSFNFRPLNASYSDEVSAAATNAMFGKVGLVARYQDGNNHYSWMWGTTDQHGPKISTATFDRNYGPSSCQGIYKKYSGEANYQGIRCAAGPFVLCASNGADAQFSDEDVTPVTAVPPFIRPNQWHYGSFKVVSTPTGKGTYSNDFEVKVNVEESRVGPLPYLKAREEPDGSPALLKGQAGFHLWNVKVQIADVVIRRLAPEEVPTGTCGDGVCRKDHGEDCTNCEDCEKPCGCGDGFCEGDNEVLACPADCGVGQIRDVEEGEGSAWDGMCPPKYNIPGTGIIRSQDGPSSQGYRAQVAAYFSFDDLVDPYFDNVGHNLGFYLPGLEMSSSVYVTECGTRLVVDANDAVVRWTKPRPGGCVKANPFTPARLRVPRSAFGIMPVAQCPFTITFWAQVSTTSVQGEYVLKWGDHSAGRRLFGAAIEVCGSTSSSTCPYKTRFRLGHRVLTSNSPNWADGHFHHIGVVYNPQDNLMRLYVDGREVPESPYAGSCDISGTRYHVFPLITYGSPLLAKFAGYLDELKIMAVEWTDEQFIADALVFNFFKFALPSGEVLTPAPPGSGVPPPTPQWLPQPPKPTPSTPAPTIVTAGAPLCQTLTSCIPCLIRSDVCQWCNAGGDQVCFPKGLECPAGADAVPGVCVAPDEKGKVSPLKQGTPCGTNQDGSVAVADICGICGGGETKPFKCPAAADSLHMSLPLALAALAAVATHLGLL